MQMLRRNWAISHTTNRLFLFFIVTLLLQVTSNCAIAQMAKVNADTSIGGRIFLDDFESISKTLVIEDSDFKIDTKNDLNYLVYRNSNNHYLRLYLYPGNGCCQYFEVGYLPKQNKKIKQTTLKLETESKIHLGISLASFIKIKDTKSMSKKVANGIVTYEYARYSDELSQIRYSAIWVFKNKRLIKFGFGNTAYNP